MPTVDIITLADAKTHLNITDTTNDTELGNFITAASQMWVNRVGPVNTTVTTFDEWYDGGLERIVVRHAPVVSVTKVEEVYSAATIYTLNLQTLQSGGDASSWGYTVDLTTGTFTRRAVGVDIPFASGERNVHVVYTAGYATAPEDIKLAVKLLVQHMWDTQRGGAKRPGSGGQEWTPALGFTWPNRIEEIAKAYTIPGIA